MDVIKKYYKLIYEQENKEENKDFENNENQDQTTDQQDATLNQPNDQDLGVDQMNLQEPGAVNPEEQPLDSAFIGKKFELNKIYQRLITLQSFLSDISDEKLLVLRQYVINSIELFELMINNITAYRGEMDDIIVLYYKFLTLMYNLIKDYHDKTEQIY